MKRLMLAVLLSAACGKNQSPPPPSSGSPGAKPESAPSASREPSAPAQGQARGEAEDLFGRVCASCHGTGGLGDGPGAASLNPRPRNYTDAAWQASVTDDQIKEIIVKGGAAVGKSAMMPAQKQLAGKPEVLDGLVQIIRGFKK